MTTFITDGNPLISAFLIAITNGEADASTEDVESNLSSSYLTNKPIKVKEIT